MNSAQLTTFVKDLDKRLNETIEVLGKIAQKNVDHDMGLSALRQEIDKIKFDLSYIKRSLESLSALSKTSASTYQ